MAERQRERGPAPIAIGGVGGSGTRVVAAIIQRAGFYLGDDLNRSLDNLWFTYLFRRPRWARGGRNRGSFDRNLRVFQDAMQGRFAWKPTTIAALAGAYREMAGEYDRDWVKARIRAMATSTGPTVEARGWGWKEPNTHVMLSEIASSMPRLRYIHVVRHGLDMAFSRNQHQLRRWARRYGIPDDLVSAEERSARFWLAANERTVTFGRETLGDRFHIVDFDRLAREPLDEVTALLEFVEIPADSAESFIPLVQAPDSIGRHLSHLDRFSDQTISAVNGFMAALERD